MRRMKKVLLFVVLCMTVCMFFTIGADAKTGKKVKSLAIKEYKKSGITLGIGETKQLHRKVKPEKVNTKKLKWQSSKTKIVSVSSKGKLKAKKVGTAKITILAKDGSRKKASVTVKVIRKVEKITISNASKIKEITKNSKIKIQTVILPKSASNRSLVWKSSKKSVATVSQKGVICAKKQGTAEITATPKYGKKNVKARLKVKVKVPVKEIKLKYETTDENRLADNKMKYGATYKIIATVKPQNADLDSIKWACKNQNGETGLNKITFSKSKIKIKRYKDKDYCEITIPVRFYKVGDFTITATAKDAKKKEVKAPLTLHSIKVDFKSTKYQFVAHRGYTRASDGTIVPENTIASFDAAVAEKFRMIELDVYRTGLEKEDGTVEAGMGEYVVAHDNKFENYCGEVNGNGKKDLLITETPLQRLKKYPIIQNLNSTGISALFDYSKEYRIPTLEEYLGKLKKMNEGDYKDNPVKLFIEFKHPGDSNNVSPEEPSKPNCITKDDADKMIELVKKYNVEHYVYYTSFNKADLQIMRDKGIAGEKMELTISPSTTEDHVKQAVEECKKYGYCLGCPVKLVTKNLVTWMHSDDDRGKPCKISAWLTNGFFEVDQMIQMGVDYLTTNGYTSENKKRDNVPWNE